MKDTIREDTIKIVTYVPGQEADNKPVKIERDLFQFESMKIIEEYLIDYACSPFYFLNKKGEGVGTMEITPEQVPRLREKLESLLAVIEERGGDEVEKVYGPVKPPRAPSSYDLPAMRPFLMCQLSQCIYAIDVYTKEEVEKTELETTSA